MFMFLAFLAAAAVQLLAQFNLVPIVAAQIVLTAMLAIAGFMILTLYIRKRRSPWRWGMFAVAILAFLQALTFGLWAYGFLQPGGMPANLEFIAAVLTALWTAPLAFALADYLLNHSNNPNVSVWITAGTFGVGVSSVVIALYSLWTGYDISYAAGTSFATGATAYTVGGLLVSALFIIIFNVGDRSARPIIALSLGHAVQFLGAVVYIITDSGMISNTFTMLGWIFVFGSVALYVRGRFPLFGKIQSGANRVIARQ